MRLKQEEKTMNSAGQGLALARTSLVFLWTARRSSCEELCCAVLCCTVLCNGRYVGQHSAAARDGRVINKVLVVRRKVWSTATMGPRAYQPKVRSTVLLSIEVRYVAAAANWWWVGRIGQRLALRQALAARWRHVGWGNEDEASAKQGGDGANNKPRATTAQVSAECTKYCRYYCTRSRTAGACS